MFFKNHLGWKNSKFFVDYDIKAVEEASSLYFADRNTNLYSNCGEQFDTIYKN